MNLDIPNYTLLRKLGAGAFAEVWLAEHRNNRRKAAIKILKDSVEAGADAEALFLREGEVLASFSERNIVTIFDNARVGNTAYLIMEFLPGGSLLDRMNQRGLEVGEAIGFVVQIAAALDAAHRKQIIHRDLKPANIMLRDETTPVLTDFGASRLLQRSTIYGKDGGVVGTPHYMSPEQITGQVLDGRSDLYALGVMFHELLTGRVPYNGTVNEILALHLHGPLPQLPPNLAVLQPVLDRLLAKLPAQRFSTGAEFADALRRCFLDQAALRQLVDFAPSSAWSSQLKALGFNLQLQERNEVRIAQGEFLKHAQTQPLDRNPPPLPAARAEGTPPVGPDALAATGGWTVWALRPACACLIALTLVLVSGDRAGLMSVMETAIVGALGGVLAIYLLWAAAAWRRRWWWFGLCALGAGCTLAAIVLGVIYLNADDRSGLEDSLWPIPVCVGLLILLSPVALGLARRSWPLGVGATVAVAATWALMAYGLDSDVSALPLLVSLALGSSIAVWIGLALSTRSQARSAPEWRARSAPALSLQLGLWAMALVLVLLAAWPIVGQLQQISSARAGLVGEWFGLSALGPVRVELGVDGTLSMQPEDSAAAPWQAQWSVGEDLYGYDLQANIVLGSEPDAATSVSTVYKDAPTPLLSFDPSFWDLLSVKKRHAPMPLILQRHMPGRELDFAGFDRELSLICSDGRTATLRINSDGTGRLQQLTGESGKALGADAAQVLNWGYYSEPSWDPRLVFVLRAPWPSGLEFYAGYLGERAEFREAQLRLLNAASTSTCTLNP